MGQRRRSREAALQVVYSQTFSGLGPGDAIAHVARIEDEERQPPDEFAAALVERFATYREEIDAGIGRSLENWTIDRLAPVDLALLRLGVAELTYVDDVPPKVTINEYVELAKRYGSDEAPKFVNAILDRVHKRGGR